MSAQAGSSSAGRPSTRRAWTAPLVWGLATAVAVRVLSQGFELAKDSQSYIEGIVIRTPLYPLLIAGARAVAGDAGLGLVFVLQSLFGVASAAAFTLYCARRFGLRAWQATVIAAVVLLPFYGPLTVGNRILTEAVAYGLFLCCARWLVEGAITRSPAGLAAAFAFAAAAVLTRPQFLFVYPVAAIVVFWVLTRDRRRGAVAAAALAAAVLLGAFADRAYHWARHDAFTSVPFLGLQLMAPALYLAEPEDARRFEGDGARLFTAIERAARAGGLLADANPSPGGISTFSHHYQRSYNDIVWRTLQPAVAAHLHGGDTLVGEDFLATDRILQPMALTLMRARPAAFTRLYLSNVLGRIGLYYGLVMLILLGYALARAARGDPLATAVVVVTLLHLANLALVALVEPLKPRYSFYTDGVYLALLIAWMTRDRGRPEPCAG